MRKMLLCLGTITLASAMLLTTGCHRPTSAHGVRANYTPELHSTGRTFQQHQAMETRTIDTNLRGLYDDGARVLLMDRPSRLSPYPVP